MFDLDVDIIGLVDFADVIFANDFNDDSYEKELSFQEFMELILAFRGSNNATVKDIENLRKMICQSIAKCQKQVQTMDQNVTEIFETRQTPSEYQTPHDRCGSK